MTTNVFDSEKKTIACDSRWSVPGTFGVLYVDEAPFLKMEVTQKGVFVFAGCAPVIDAWKSHLKSIDLGTPTPAPTLKGIALLGAERGTGRLLGYSGQDIVLPHVNDIQASFAGTGSYYAAMCWLLNKSAQQAVSTAIGQDSNSGGSVRFYDLSTDVNNLVHCQGIASLDQAFLEKGMVMFNSMKNANPIPFKQAAEMNPAVNELYSKAASGSLRDQVQAPCDAIFNEPTPQDEERVRNMLEMLKS